MWCFEKTLGEKCPFLRLTEYRSDSDLQPAAPNVFVQVVVVAIVVFVVVAVGFAVVVDVLALGFVGIAVVVVDIVVSVVVVFHVVEHCSCSLFL